MSIKCLINAGATREYIDTVRFISNPSSGKFGCNLALAALALGWQVDLVLASSTFDRKLLKDINIIDVKDAQDMYEACKERFTDADIFIASAAVCDMKPKQKFDHKIKKPNIDYSIEFEPTIDVLKTISKDKANQILVGFAAESDNLRNYALKKLKEKNLNCIVANDISNSKAFEKDDNEVSIIFNEEKSINLDFAPKSELAKQIVDILNKEFFQKA